MTDTRFYATQILAAVVKEGRSLAELLSEKQAKLKDQRDINLLNTLCMGAARCYVRFVHTINTLVEKPLKAKDIDIQVLLVIGMYQLWYLDMPSYAAVSSCVDAAKKLGKKWACGLVNKVLRRAAEEKERLEAAWEKNEEQLFSHPQWLIEEIKAAWPEHWRAVLLANNERPALVLRVQTERISREAYCQQLTAAGIEWSLPTDAAQAVCIPDSPPVRSLPGFSEGLFYVQDLSGQRVVDLLDLAPGQRVLDACAAPGSKTTHILTRQSQLEALVALDNQPDRLALITENLQRLGLQEAPIRLVLADALRVQQWWDGQPFDRVLVDAPCTASGVIRRHPEIRLRRSQEDIEHCSTLQLQMLEQLWKVVKPGGFLVYTTCSILPAENDAVIKKFLQQNSNAKTKSFKIPNAIKTAHGRQLLPSLENDGFYYARLQKSE